MVWAVLFTVLAMPDFARAQFETRSVFPVGQAQPFSLAVGDFNRDGVPDLAVMNFNNTVDILLGNGDGTFTLKTSYAVAVSYNIVTASLRHNGILDLVVAGTGADDYVSVMLGEGDGTFQPPVAYSTMAGSNMVGLGDFTGHGNVDVMNLEGTSSLGVACDCIQTLPGNGDGTFGAPITTYITDMRPGAIATGDFNNDGKLDVAVSGAFFSTYQVDILLGSGDGTFAEQGSYSLSGGGPIAAGSFTSDKTKVDLAVGNGSGVGVLLGTGDGTFQSPVYYETGGFATWVIAEDVDGDGKVDLATSNTNPAGVSVFKGNGDGTFQAAALYPVGDSPNLQYIAAADFNGDGKPDLVVAALDGEQVTTLLNTGSAAFSPTSPLTFSNQLLGTTSSPQTVTLTNSGTTAMTISSVTSSGPPFRMTANTCSGSLAPHEQCSISAEFSAYVKGTVSGGITINDSASSKPQFVELIGIGTELAITPAKIQFPPQKIGSQSAPRVIHLNNIGKTNMGFTRTIFINGNIIDAEQFSQTNNCGAFLPPGGSCDVTVTFSPQRKSTFKAYVDIEQNGGFTPENVAITGRGD